MRQRRDMEHLWEPWGPVARRKRGRGDDLEWLGGPSKRLKTQHDEQAIATLGRIGNENTSRLKQLHGSQGHPERRL
jgi:hypothetical protein